MSFKYGMLSVLLFIIILLLAIKNYDALTHPLELVPDQGETKISEPRTERSLTIGALREPVSVASYHSIAEKNIFNPERKDFPVTGSGSAMKPAVRPHVILYGVTIAKNYQSASVVNPGRPLRKGERDLMTLKLGERIGEYKLTKVSPDRITLEAPGDAFEVLLYDPKAPKKRESGPTRAASSTFTPMGAPSSPFRREGEGRSRESAQDRSTSSQIPWPGSAQTQIPPHTIPTPITPSFPPTPVMPGAEKGQPVPSPSKTLAQPQLPGGK
jgi:hypothetical protein